MVPCSAKLRPKADLAHFRRPILRLEHNRILALLVWVLVLVGGVYAQGAAGSEPETVLVNGVTDTTVFGMGKSVKIEGTVKQGAMSLGGDVIVAGTVEGDVASIGGSVYQLPGARIEGDVIVIGGAYYPSDPQPLRKKSSMTMMYAGYQQELRDMMRNPLGIITPRWTPQYLGTRLLVMLFWFVISVAVTAVMPRTISRGIARLQLTSLRVALIGLIGVVVFGAGPLICLWIVPQPVSVLVGLLALLLWIVAGVFGRVILYAATGRWLQRKYFPVGKNSETIALLLGSAFWVLLTSLPYIWPFVVAVILVVSLGLTLTARYREGWQRPESSPGF